MSIQQFASSFHYFTVAINGNPTHAYSYMFLGLSLNKLNDFNNAVQAMEQALKIEKDYYIYLNYTIILAGHGEGQEETAKKMFAEFETRFQ